MRVKCPKCKTDVTALDTYYCKCGENIAKQKLIQYLIGEENGNRNKKRQIAGNNKQKK